MRRSEGKFKSADGLNLFWHCQRPDGEARAVVVITHGYGEHSGRYAHVADYLLSNGCAVYMFDLRGHGRSEGARACVSLFEGYLCDLDLFLERVNKEEGERPVFLLGHSMGGTIVALSAITRKLRVRGLVLSGALLKVSDKISTPLRIFISLAGTIFPSFPILKAINGNKVSSDPQAAKRYNDDPLVYHGSLLARQAREINRAIERVRKKTGEISLPLLVLHGSSDCLVDIEGSRELYARAGSADKAIKIYEGFYHEILNEPGKERVLSDVAAWIEKRAQS